MIKSQAVPVRGDDVARRPVNDADPDAGAHRYIGLFIPSLRFQPQALKRRFAAEIRLGQGRSLIRECVFGAEQGDRALIAALAQLRRGGEASLSGADDQGMGHFGPFETGFQNAEIQRRDSGKSSAQPCLPIAAGRLTAQFMTTRACDLPDLAATAALGAHLAAALQTGDAVRLFGDLGAGKTTLARAVIEALTGEAEAPSPTYTLVQTYETRDGRVLAHADLYRLNDEAELEELGLDEALDHGVALIEWPDRAPGFQPDSRLDVELTATGEASRRVRLTGHGRWEGALDRLKL